MKVLITLYAISFKYNEIEYFYKYDYPREPFRVSPYNELVACEIADDLFIPHVNYNLASICGFKGLISKCNIYLNNLEDIWITLEEYYDRNLDYQNVVSKVMQKIVNMFIFDILIGQVDRDATNWWFIEYPNGHFI